MYYDLSVKFSFLYICAAVFLSDIIKIQLPKKNYRKKIIVLKSSLPTKMREKLAFTTIVA